jgi:WD40 repeat protein
VNFAVLSPDEKEVYFGGYEENDGFFRGLRDDFTGLYKATVASPNVREVFDMPSEQLSYFGFEFNSNQHGITDGTLDYAGKYVVFTGGYAVYFWDIARNKLAYSIKTKYSTNNVTSVADGMYVWAEGRLIKISAGNRYEVEKVVDAGILDGSMGYSRIAVSQSGKALATGDDGNLVNVWSAGEIQRQQVLAGHRGTVRSFLFWKNDSVLITGGYDKTIRIWTYPENREVVKNEETAKKDTVTRNHDRRDGEPSDTVSDTGGREVLFKENNVPVSVKNRPVKNLGTFKVLSPDLEIEVWDDAAQDGDLISLNINGRWILENYEVRKEKLKLQIQVEPFTNNYLILFAHNLGQIPPNTAAISVRDGKTVRKLVLSSDLNRCGALNFVYEPE